MLNETNNNNLGKFISIIRIVIIYCNVENKTRVHVAKIIVIEIYAWPVC